MNTSTGFADSSYTNGMPGVTYDSPVSVVGVSDDGTFLASQGTIGNVGFTFAVGDVMQLYLAPGGGVYIGKIGAGWTTGHDPTASDPPFYTLPAETWRPCAGGDKLSTQQTLNFGASAWAGTPPAGATGWTA